VPGDKTNSIPLLDYHASKEKFKPPVACPIAEAVRAYQYKPEHYDPAAKVPLLPFMPPFLHGSFCPARTLQNEEMCVQERISKVRPDPNELIMTPYLFARMQEFVNLLIPKPHELQPTDLDEVMDRQPRPSQRRKILSSAGSLPRRLIDMFIKSESYGNIKPPRPISTINSVDKVAYSRFMYAF